MLFEQASDTTVNAQEVGIGDVVLQSAANLNGRDGGDAAEFEDVFNGLNRARSLSDKASQRHGSCSCGDNQSLTTAEQWFGDAMLVFCHEEIDQSVEHAFEDSGHICPIARSTDDDAVGGLDSVGYERHVVGYGALELATACHASEAVAYILIVKVDNLAIGAGGRG